MDSKKANSKGTTSDWEMAGVRMPPDLKHAVKQFALDKKTTVQDVTIEALRDFLKRNGGKLPKV